MFNISTPFILNIIGMDIGNNNYYPYLYVIDYIFDDNQNGNALFNMHDNN